MKQRYPSQLAKKQFGVVLIVGMVMLLLATMIGMTAVQTTTLQEKMAANQQDRQKALQAAEAAARYAWNNLDKGSADFDVKAFTDNATKHGLYDLRSAGIITSSGNKLLADWNDIASPSSWLWDGSTERAVMPDKVASGDPMKLAVAPQYAIGMYAPILRKGTENRKCIPFSIIGAGQGSNETSRALVQLQVIPKGGCFRDIVK